MDNLVGLYVYENNAEGGSNIRKNMGVEIKSLPIQMVLGSFTFSGNG